MTINGGYSDCTFCLPFLENFITKNEKSCYEHSTRMEINWAAVGWIIDMILNGLVWLIIAVLSLLLIDATDKWTRKAIKLADKADKWIRKFTENSFDWVEEKNLQIPASIILLIIFGILSQLEIIPKLIT